MTARRSSDPGVARIESSTNNVCFIFRLAGTPEENEAAKAGVKVYFQGDEPSFEIVDADPHLADHPELADELDLLFSEKDEAFLTKS